MTNHEILLHHFLSNPEYLNAKFGYDDVYCIAQERLRASTAGVKYAVLKFLQKYCNPLNLSDAQLAVFRSGDPRENENCADIVNRWKFELLLSSPEQNFRKEVFDQRAERKVELSPGYKKWGDILDLDNFPDYYKQYSWDGKHKLFGYPPDTYPNFSWIFSLEQRFEWLKKNSTVKNTSSRYLLQEMIEWGGSQNGVLQKFNDGSGEVNLYDLVQNIIASLNSRNDAIKASLNLPGLGLTYASKLLRFMEPEIYGALDSRIRSALKRKDLLSQIYDGNMRSMTDGYVEFLSLLNDLKERLNKRNICKPVCNLSKHNHWRAADVEMALFCWAEVSD